MVPRLENPVENWIWCFVSVLFCPGVYLGSCRLLGLPGVLVVPGSSCCSLGVLRVPACPWGCWMIFCRMSDDILLKFRWLSNEFWMTFTWFVNDFLIILRSLLDHFQMHSWWFPVNCRWVWDDFGMIFRSVLDDFGMSFRWVLDDFGMIFRWLWEFLRGFFSKKRLKHAHAPEGWVGIVII